MDTSVLTAALLLSLPTVITSLLWVWYAASRVAATQTECDGYREACSQVSAHLLAAKLVSDNGDGDSPKSRGAGFAAILAERDDSDDEANDDEDDGDDDDSDDCHR